MGFLNVPVTSPDLLIPGHKDSQGCDVLCLTVFSDTVLNADGIFLFFSTPKLPFNCLRF